MRLILAFLLLAHGIAHLPGLLVGWEWASFPELPFRTTVFGTIDIGTFGARLVGLGWGLASVSFIVLAAGLALRAEMPPATLPLALGFSAVLCLSAWPEAGYGFVANGVIAAMLVAGDRFGLLS